MSTQTLGEIGMFTEKQLYIGLKRYTDKNNVCYDPVFDKKIRELKPHWFFSNKEKVSKKKSMILEEVKNGSNRKDLKKLKLLNPFVKYTSKNSKIYDPIFDKKIRKLRPDLFETQWDKAQLKKDELLKIAKNGDSRPSQKCHRLGKAICQYTRLKSKSYDPVFDKKIRSLRPDWFDIQSKNSKLKKEKIIHIAEKGFDKPISRCLNNYTNKKSGSYDPVFDKKIRKLRPEWFLSQTERAKINKIKIIKLAKSGKNKPIGKNNFLANKISSYTNKVSSSYDPVFDKELRSLRPDWFAHQKKRGR